LKLAGSGVNLLGTSAENIDRAEDRAKFSELLDNLGIAQPKWKALSKQEDVQAFASGVGFPVLVRPSYVLSGSAMRVASSSSELERYLAAATKVSQERPVVVSKFVDGAREVEVDGLSDGHDVLIGAMIEHVENAGVHSGDATMSIPVQTLTDKEQATIEDYTRKIAVSLEIKGPFNIQYLVKEGEASVIECNLRASRSMPYVSKVRGVNLMEYGTMIMLGKSLKDLDLLRLPPIKHVAVKVPQFSFMRLNGADPVLGVEMLSTGEVACLGEDFDDALRKALDSADFKSPPNGGSVLMTVGGKEMKKKLVPLAIELSKRGFRICATEHTAEMLRNNGIERVLVLHKVREPTLKPNIVDFISKGKIDLVINIPLFNKEGSEEEVLRDEYRIRRLAVEFNVPIVTNLELASALVRVMSKKVEEAPVRSLNEYTEAMLLTHSETKINSFLQHINSNQRTEID
jgi:carbamoyl-phosphate synthase large subunit